MTLNEIRRLGREARQIQTIKSRLAWAGRSKGSLLETLGKLGVIVASEASADDLTISAELLDNGPKH